MEQFRLSLESEGYAYSWRQLTEYFPDAVISTDANARITEVNSAACNLLGYSLEEFREMELIDLFEDNLNRRAEPTTVQPAGSVVKQARVSKDQTDSFESIIRHKSGEIIPVLVSSNKLVETVAGQPTFIAIIKDIRSLKEAQEKEVEAQKRFETLFNNIHDAVFLAPLFETGEQGKFVEVNDISCQRLGYSREELLQLNSRAINPKANYNKVAVFDQKIMRDGSATFEAIHVTKDGTQFPVDVVAKVIELDGQNYVLSMVKDMREHKALATEQERFGKLLEHSSDEIYVYDSSELRFLQVNQGAFANLGYTSNELLQKKVTDIQPELNEKDFRELTRPLLDGSQSQIIFETLHQRSDGSRYPVEVHLQLSHNEVPPVYLANVQDITLRKKNEERLRYLANYDSLTGLPNRALFMDRLNMAIENSKRTWVLNALMFLDLDGFKGINDTMGHDAGDLLIKEVAQRISQCLRKSDTVYRMGGDEFTIIATNQLTVEGAEITAQRIIEAVSAPFCIYGQEIQTSASIGISIFPFEDEMDVVHLLKQADSAMYQAKSSGKNSYHFFTAELAVEESARVQMENALKKAISNNEFHLVFQPRVALNTGKVIGAEALLRWENDQLGQVFPDIFIPLLESTGAIKEVGRWVLFQACQQVREWVNQGLDLRVSINVSGRQLEDGDLADLVREALELNNLPPSSLEVEITEGILLCQDCKVLTTLTELRELGVAISLDDFGTGYSSLSYLKKYPIDILKIDRSFIRDLDHSEDNITLVDTIINMARSLKMRVTAEGIEKQEHADFLRKRNCEEGQGYFFARPLKVEDFFQLVSKS